MPGVAVKAGVVVHELAGFYAFDDKTMYLLNWIELSKQEPVMAHELTHALQDQNFDLPKWNGIHGNDAANKADSIDTEARLAAVEGQAMVTFLDYMIRPSGRTLADIPNAVDTLRSIILSSYDSGVSFHNAPPLLKETTYFPYLDGFAFEMEVQKREGTEGAFAGVFKRPPHNTHEIIHPEDYIAHVQPATFALPDLTSALASYKLYDSGEIGELDVRIMATSFGRENDAYTVAAQWNGGSYQAVLKPSAATKPTADLTPGDLGLVYVSKWKSYQAAARFAQLYQEALLKRSKATGPTAPTECLKKTECAIKWSAHFTTDDGPVTMEVAQDNTLVITQGLQESAVTQVKQALAHAPQGDSRASSEPELSLKFAALPQMRALREQVFGAVVANAGRF